MRDWPLEDIDREIATFRAALRSALADGRDHTRAAAEGYAKHLDTLRFWRQQRLAGKARNAPAVVDDCRENQT